MGSGTQTGRFSRTVVNNIHLTNYTIRRERLMKGNQVRDTNYYVEHNNSMINEQVQPGSSLWEVCAALFANTERMADFEKVNNNLDNLDQVFREWKLTRLILRD